METTLQTPTCEDKIAKIIDRVLKQVFGDEATFLIYKHLEQNYSLKRDEIGKKVDLFAQGLEDFLRSGAYAIERKILDDVYASSGSLKRWELEKADDECGFVSQIKAYMQKA